VTVPKVIKAAQRIGFTLDNVADLITAGGHHHSRIDTGLQERPQAKLSEVEAKIAVSEVIASTFREATAAGYDGLVARARQPCYPIRWTRSRRKHRMSATADRVRRLMPLG
jgi:MerR family transcriptional regulator, mercuric resistance operon regulatory protein